MALFLRGGRAPCALLSVWQGIGAADAPSSPGAHAGRDRAVGVVSAFAGLVLGLLVVWLAVAPAEERWWGVGMFALVGGVLLAVKWIGADREDQD